MVTIVVLLFTRSSLVRPVIVTTVGSFVFALAVFSIVDWSWVCSVRDCEVVVGKSVDPIEVLLLGGNVLRSLFDEGDVMSGEATTVAVVIKSIISTVVVCGTDVIS